ncbi:hypothetical protein U91I_02281 [alpha proteobacterium U9-1i]|nr:hypothetical protein U91I_02281 [alpha proteobacterium U9-1i]
MRAAFAGYDRWMRKLALAALALVLTACATAPPSSSSSAAPGDIVGDWRLREIDSRPIASAVHAHMRLDANGQVSGSGGCNGYSGAYRRDGAALVFTDVIITTASCAGRDGETRMQVERRFVNTLTGAVRIDTPALDHLLLTGEDGRTLSFERGLAP